MKRNRKLIAAGAATLAIAAGGAGVAWGVSGDSDERVTGPDAERAKAAAIEAVGGGSVTEVEHQDGDGAGVFEVEVKREDGSEVEVHLDGSYNQVGMAEDDDSGEGPGDDDGPGDD